MNKKNDDFSQVVLETKKLIFDAAGDEKADYAADNAKESGELSDALTKITGTPGAFAKIPIISLESAPEEWNPFTKPSPEKRAMMTESIYTNGLLQPIVVRARDRKNSRFQILAGHNRVECFKVLKEITGDAKYDEIDAKIYWHGQITDEQAMEIISDTNFIQRANLPVKDKAYCIANKARSLRSRNEKGDIMQTVADQFGISRTSVFYWGKLVNLIPEFSEMFSSGKLSLLPANRIASFPKVIQHEMYNFKELITNSAIMKIPANSDPADVIRLLKEAAKPKRRRIKMRRVPDRHIAYKFSKKPARGEKIVVLCLSENEAGQLAQKYSEYVVMEEKVK